MMSLYSSLDKAQISSNHTLGSKLRLCCLDDRPLSAEMESKGPK